MGISHTVDNPVGYWGLLRQNDRFRRLWAAQLISAAGDWFNSVALLGLVLQLTKSGFGVSIVLLCSTIPTFFLTPIAGPVVDRFDRRTLMIWTNVFSAVIALLFLLVRDTNSIGLVYVGTIFLVMSASFFAPASFASIPNIVSRPELFSANALSGASWGIMVMVGSALGGIISTLFGRDVAFVLNSISFVVAALLIATINIPSPKTERALNPWRDFVEGIHYLRGYFPAVGLVGVKTGWGLAAGTLILLSVFGQQVFKAGDAGIGIMYSARGVGALIGPFIVQGIFGRDVKSLRRVIWVCFLMGAVGYALLSWSGWLNIIWLGCLGLIIAHFGGGTNWAISNVLLQLTTPDHLRGRVLAVDNGLNTLATGISTLFFGAALQGGALPMNLALVGALIFGSYGMLWVIVTWRGPVRISEATVVVAAPQQK